MLPSVRRWAFHAKQQSNPRLNELSRRVEKVVGYPPLSELGDLQRRESHEALLEAGSFEDLPGRWQAAILAAEQNRR